jgi:N-acetylglucosaminyl-diphospho-decaprenol L-rhamnosyltransferase
MPRGASGHAHRSIVPHPIGSIGKLTERSALSVYLDFRNRVHFVRMYHPAWLPWTVLVLLLRPLAYGFAGSTANMRVAWLGVFRGLAGETGRPDRLLHAHRR